MAMFVYGDDLREAINRVLHSRETSCAVAFWGKGSEKSFGENAEKVRIVCNLKAGGTNPLPLKALIDDPRFEIRQCDRLHAKVYIGDETAVVTSANNSTNGMGVEGKPTFGLIEAGVVLTQIESVKKWFDDLWDDKGTTKRVTRLQLDKVPIPRGPAVGERERPSYVVAWSEWFSPSGEDAFDALSEEVQDPNVWAYEDWTDLPVGAYLFDFQIRKRSVAYTGCWETYAPHFTYNKSDGGVIVACKRVRGNDFDHKLKALPKQKPEEWKKIQNLIKDWGDGFSAIEPNVASLREVLQA
jgi:hypothetical protein